MCKTLMFAISTGFLHSLVQKSSGIFRAQNHVPYCVPTTGRGTRVLVQVYLEETEFLVLGMITKALISNDQIFGSIQVFFVVA